MDEYLDILKQLMIKDPETFENFLHKLAWRKMVFMEQMSNVKDYADIRLIQGKVAELSKIINYFRGGKNG